MMNPVDAYTSLYQMGTPAMFDLSNPQQPIRWDWVADADGIRTLQATLHTGGKQDFHYLIHPDDLSAMRERAMGRNNGTQDLVAAQTRH